MISSIFSFNRRAATSLAIVILASAMSSGAAKAEISPDALNRAVRVAGGTDSAHASPAQFLTAFNATLSRTTGRTLPAHVSSAIQARPDLSARIVILAIRRAAHQAEDREALQAAVIAIVRAAVLANPTGAAAIVAGAIQVAPFLRGDIVAAAIAAAPSQENAIVAASARSTRFAAVLRAAGSEGFRAGFTSIGADSFSDIGRNVVSPEQAPTTR